MFCENCGAQLEDGSKFCTECGSPVNYDETVSPVSSVPQNTAPSGKSSGKNMLVPIIISVSMAVIVALAIVAFFFVRKGFDKIKSEVTGYETLSEDKEEETEPEKPVSHDEDEDYDNDEDEFVSLNEADDDEDDFVSLFDDDETEYAPDTETVDEGDIQTGHDFIIEDSGIEIIDKDSAKQLSDEELRLAINEIYARHGRKFKSSDLQEYFDSKSWYEPKYEPDEFDKKQKTILSDVEIKNLETLTAIRKERGN